ncbi:AAA family ATPase [Chitinophaga pinensis]|uniref:AAA family ATPase n=1 Tax=Chitinophaga pinensis TaxID=79329 RepID=A0A5C6LUD6_9BACT|nr:AAA family ATPase [Chitinophaga pinensis]TWV99348.1 AAA family ATPase [Chitinophaga pinensis]
MLLQFKIRNYRSYKEEVTFSMEAESSKLKGNIFDFELGNTQNVRYLKTSAIYGANASGKTNLVRALSTMIYFIIAKPKVDEPIELYDPFRFDEKVAHEPAYFELTFIGPHNYKYIYSFEVKGKEVLTEDLYFYPNSRRTLLFKRQRREGDNMIHTGILGDSMNKKEISVFANQLVLSKFGDDEPDELLSSVFLYFVKYIIINAVNANQQALLRQSVSHEIFGNEVIRNKVAAILQAADTKISGLDLIKYEPEKVFDEEKRRDVRRLIHTEFIFCIIFMTRRTS